MEGVPYTVLACRRSSFGDIFKEDSRVSTKVSTWLNRVLAMTLEDQELIFQYFSNTLEAVIRAEKSRGDYDQGIMSVKASSVTIEKQTVIHTDTQSGTVLSRK